MKIEPRGFKTELRPNLEQRRVLGRWCGASRWVYNWGLEERIKAYTEREETLSHYAQDKAFTQLKKIEGNEWLNEIPRRIAYFALRDLDRAYKNFFRRVKQGGENPGFPRFKSRSRSRSSFTLYANDYAIREDRIRLPKLGEVRLKEKGYLPVGAEKYRELTISERAGRWFVSVVADVPHVKPELTGETIAAHAGVRVHLTLSDGTRSENPQAFEVYRKRLKRFQQKLARQKKGSANREKTKRKIQETYYRMECLRLDDTHKATHMATTGKRPSRLVMQQWDVRGMLEDEAADLPRRVRTDIRRRVADANMSELHRQLQYKAAREGIDLIDVPNTYPVTLRCSSCGHVKDSMPISATIYRCEKCGSVKEREHNSVDNLLQYVANNSDKA